MVIPTACQFEFLREGKKEEGIGGRPPNVQGHQRVYAPSAPLHGTRISSSSPASTIHPFCVPFAGQLIAFSTSCHPIT